jgi:hypothetical protein
MTSVGAGVLVSVGGNMAPSEVVSDGGGHPVSERSTGPDRADRSASAVGVSA